MSPGTGSGGSGNYWHLPVAHHVPGLLRWTNVIARLEILDALDRMSFIDNGESAPS